MEALKDTSFPGGYDITDVIAAVKISAGIHVQMNVPFGETDKVIVDRFFRELTARHPEALADPYRFRGQELLDERRSLRNSHLQFSWFALAYATYGLIAVRSGISTAPHHELSAFLTPMRGALRELGVQMSSEECLAEIDRFIPAEVTPRSVEAAALTFLSFARFLHYGALRRREAVTSGLTLPPVCLAFIEEDAQEARDVSNFLIAHGVSISQQPAQFTRTTRLLVLFSRHALESELFWRSLADWKERQVVPMVVCLMPKAELYREPPADERREVWTWLKANVAVELRTGNERYLHLLRALDSSDPKQWWWNAGDAIELGLAVDMLRLGIPRPATHHNASPATGEPYPFAVDGSLLAACIVASNRLDERYFAICRDLLELRQKPNGEPYLLPWFVLIYRAWQALATENDLPEQAERELQYALFALGIGTEAAEVPAFLEKFARLPWATPPSTPAAVDERTIAFMVLVHHLSQSALARTQRMRLRHPYCPSFVSYARADEAFARELVAHLEAKGADVWWDLNSLTLGTVLDDSLRSAVGDAKFLLLIATPAADESPWVRMEVETAVRDGLRVIRISPDDPLPATQQSVLAQLERSPSEQLRWLTSQTMFENFREQLAQARASLA